MRQKIVSVLLKAVGILIDEQSKMSIKIQSGLWKGRFIQSPPSSITRPSSSLLKKAFFNIFDVEGALFADLFAGSGAVGIEALSLGAKKALFVEKNPPCLKVLYENLQSLKVDSSLFEILKTDVFKAIEKLASFAPLDHAFLDPPYSVPSKELLTFLERLWPSIGNGGFIHLEQSKQTLAFWQDATIGGRSSFPIRNYGDTLLITWQKG